MICVVHSQIFKIYTIRKFLMDHISGMTTSKNFTENGSSLVTSVWPFVWSPVLGFPCAPESPGEVLKYSCTCPSAFRLSWVGMGPGHEFFEHTHTKETPIEDSVCCPSWDCWSRWQRVPWGTVTTWWQCCFLRLEGSVFLPISDSPFFFSCDFVFGLVFVTVCIFLAHF